jgi:hypothetical protein
VPLLETVRDERFALRTLSAKAESDSYLLMNGPEDPWVGVLSANASVSPVDPCFFVLTVVNFIE